MKYISIDGDDIGRKITSFYLSNSDIKLQELSHTLKTSTERMADQLVEQGFTILFCAADGVVASIESEPDFSKLFSLIGLLSPSDITFSAGVGDNLREAYIALMSAKSNGKNCLHYYADISSG